MLLDVSELPAKQEHVALRQLRHALKLKPLNLVEQQHKPEAVEEVPRVAHHLVEPEELVRVELVVLPEEPEEPVELVELQVVQEQELEEQELLLEELVGLEVLEVPVVLEELVVPVVPVVLVE